MRWKDEERQRHNMTELEGRIMTYRNRCFVDDINLYHESLMMRVGGITLNVENCWTIASNSHEVMVREETLVAETEANYRFRLQNLLVEKLRLKVKLGGWRRLKTTERRIPSVKKKKNQLENGRHWKLKRISSVKKKIEGWIWGKLYNIYSPKTIRSSL